MSKPQRAAISADAELNSSLTMLDSRGSGASMGLPDDDHGDFAPPGNGNGGGGGRRGSAGASKANFDKPIDDEIPF